MKDFLKVGRVLELTRGYQRVSASVRVVLRPCSPQKLKGNRIARLEMMMLLVFHTELGSTADFGGMRDSTLTSLVRSIGLFLDPPTPIEESNSEGEGEDEGGDERC